MRRPCDRSARRRDNARIARWIADKVCRDEHDCPRGRHDTSERIAQQILTERKCPKAILRYLAPAALAHLLVLIEDVYHRAEILPTYSRIRDV